MKAARTILKNIGSMKISFWCADPQHENDRKVFGEPRSLPPGIRGAGEGRDRCKSCYNKELALRKQAIQNAELRGLLPKHAKRTVRSYSSADQGSRTSEPVDNTARLSRMASSSSSSSSSSSAAATTTALAASLAEPLEATAPPVQRTATGYLKIRQGKEPLLYPSRAHFVTSKEREERRLVASRPTKLSRVAMREVAQSALAEVPGLRRLAKFEDPDPLAVSIYHAELLKAHEKNASLQNELARKHECERVMDAYNCPLSMADVESAVAAGQVPFSHPTAPR